MQNTFTETEIWVDAKYNDNDFTGRYEISNFGRVRSVDGQHLAVQADGTSYIWSKKGVLLQPIETFDKSGRVKCYKLCLYTASKPVWVLVHKMVLESFIGPVPDGMECSHLNGIGTDCRLENLCYESHRENCGRRREHGTEAIGSRNPAAILNEAKVGEIRAMKGKRTANEIALLYGVKRSTISDVLNERSLGLRLRIAAPAQALAAGPQARR